MADFPHLPLPKKAFGDYNSPRGGSKKKLAITLVNESRRRSHVNDIMAQISEVTNLWEESIANSIAKLPNENIIPVFLQIDQVFFDIESLYAFGIDVISEEEGGYIIGASGDNFKSLKEKLAAFQKQKGIYKDKAAQLWKIVTGNQWRLDNILSAELSSKWDQIDDDEELVVDVSIACILKIPAEPKKYKDEDLDDFELRYKAWQKNKNRIELERFDLELQRQTEFETYINELEAEIISDYVNFDDSFGCRLRVFGKALKEMVLKYQYLFDVTEFDDIVYTDAETGEEAPVNLNIVAPSPDSPFVCIIDSGIQEEHVLITDAIDKAHSKSYVSASVADEVANGGHGTKVAGGVIYGREIPKAGNFQSSIIVQNAKILNQHGWLPNDLYPPQLMERVINDFATTKIFNMSINSFSACKVRHMSEWAATIDRIMYENDIIFILSAGNVDRTNDAVNKPGIQEFIRNGNTYPEYLLEPACRIANPAQSCFAITVGSVCEGDFEDEDRKSFGVNSNISSFSRCGLGLWGMIKPDVVEYAGDYIYEKAGQSLVTNHNSVSTEVIRSTIHGGNALGYHVGTSYAAPKVSHIAGALLREIPEISALLIRSLIIQGARLPASDFNNPDIKSLRKYGYGIVNKQRTVSNSESRITLIGEEKISAKAARIYTILIPEELRRTGNDYDILIEVSLSFVAKPRRTRRKTKSYLSTWVDWKSSKLGESAHRFERRIIKYMNTGAEGEEVDNDENVIKWKIRENVEWGIKDCRRQDSSIQKDWIVLQAHQLPPEFSIAVIGHQGWDKDIAKEVSV